MYGLSVGLMPGGLGRQREGGIMSVAVAKLTEALSSPKTVAEASLPTGLPESPGLYAWWLNDPQKLPMVPLTPHKNGLCLIYVGIARSRAQSSQTLRSRILGKDLRGVIGNSTLRRSLAALLWETHGWRPYWATDRAMLRPRHHEELRDWMESNLQVAWLAFPEPWTVEAPLIEQMQPPLNLSHNHNHPFHSDLRAARACLDVTASETPPASNLRAALKAVPTTGPSGDITADRLAEEMGVEVKKLRLKLRTLVREGKISANPGRWAWPADSPDLVVIRQNCP